MFKKNQDMNLQQRLRPGAAPTLFPLSTEVNDIQSIPSSPTLLGQVSVEIVKIGTVKDLELLNADTIPVGLSTIHEGVPDRGQPSFRCSFCPFFSSTIHSLHIHERHHSIKSAFHCPLCTFSVSFQTLLTQHVKRVHGLISTSDSMKRKSASTERSYECPHCRYLSSSRSSLERHLVFHNNTASHQCPHCSYSVSVGALLAKHVKNIHQECLKSSSIKTLLCDSLPKETTSNGEQSQKKKLLLLNRNVPLQRAPSDDKNVKHKFGDESDALLDGVLNRKLQTEAELRNLQSETQELWMWVNTSPGNDLLETRPEIFLTGMAHRIWHANAALVCIQMEERALREERENYYLYQPACQD